MKAHEFKVYTHNQNCEFKRRIAVEDTFKRAIRAAKRKKLTSFVIIDEYGYKTFFSKEHVEKKVTPPEPANDRTFISEERLHELMTYKKLKPLTKTH